VAHRAQVHLSANSAPFPASLQRCPWPDPVELITTLSQGAFRETHGLHYIPTHSISAPRTAKKIDAKTAQVTDDPRCFFCHLSQCGTASEFRLVVSGLASCLPSEVCEYRVLWAVCPLRPRLLLWLFVLLSAQRSRGCRSTESWHQGQDFH
jgi:hypothetical protein